MFSRSWTVGSLARRNLLRTQIYVPAGRTVTSAATVNPDEIAHFSRLSEHWWDERGEFKMLHKMNPVRTQFIRDRVLRVRQDEGMPHAIGLEGMEALDIGCGGGLLSEVCILLHRRPILNRGTGLDTYRS
jgi:hypothetical protein